jgi:hypothetical protein
MMKREVIVFEGLTKDQLYAIMAKLPEETLADVQWAASVELMDRAVVSGELMDRVVVADENKSLDIPLGPVYTDI